MKKQTQHFQTLPGLLLLIIGLITLVACTPSDNETPTVVTAVSTPVTTPTTLAAAPLTTARPTSEPTSTNTPTTSPPATIISSEDELWLTPDPFIPTRTPFPTRTLTPTPTNTPFIKPTPRDVEWPQLNNDLLFIADGALKRWNHDTNDLDILIDYTDTDIDSATSSPGFIREFQVSEDNQKVIAVRVTNREPFTQEVVHLDLVSGVSEIIVPPTPYLWRPVFSPDGSKIAYFAGDAEKFSFSSGPETGSIVVKNLSDSSPPFMIGNCINKFEDEINGNKGCKQQEIVWSPNGDFLLWSDRRGLMAYYFASGKVEVLLTHSFEDFPQKPDTVRVYLPKDWSPNGRYLRLETGLYEGNITTILDIETMQTFDIPNTFSYDGYTFPFGIWLSDNRLFQVRTDGLHSQHTTYVEIWIADQTNGGWRLDATQTLPTSQTTFVRAPIEFDDGSVGLIMLSLVMIDSTDGLYRSNSLPADLLEFTLTPTIKQVWQYSDFGEYNWAPDGSGVMVTYPGEVGGTTMEYVPSGQTTPFDLTNTVGYTISSIYWLP